MEQWLSEFQCRVADASAGRTKFPVVFNLDRAVSVEEAHDAFRAAREVDQRIVVVMHRVDFSRPSPRSEFTVRLGMPDPDPPPFMERYPMPLAG